MRPETRKVQKLGLSSLGISLPKRWVKSLEVQAGATVLVQQEDDGTLRINLGLPPVRAKTAECVVDTENCTDDGFLERLIIGSYLVGCNTIRIKARGELSPEHIGEVQRALSRLTGVTPVDQGSKHLTLENFAEPSKFPIEGLLRREYFLVLRMQNLALRVVAEGGDVREQVKIAEEEVDRLYTFIVRQLLLAARDPSVAKQIGVGDARHILGDRVLALLMENIADYYQEIADSGLVVGLMAFPKEEPFSKELATLWTDFNDLAEMSIGAFFGKDLRRANEALDRVQGILQQLQKLALEVPAPRDEEGPAYCMTCLTLQSVLRPLRSVARLYGSVAHLAINRALEEAIEQAGERAKEGIGALTSVV
jgi:phosphate uptake regulator